LVVTLSVIYCVHIIQPLRNILLARLWILSGIRGQVRFFSGGAESTIQKDLLPLIEQLDSLGVEILLKSDGMKPEEKWHALCKRLRSRVEGING